MLTSFHGNILSIIRFYVGASSVIIPDEEVGLWDAIFAEADRLGLDLDAIAYKAIDELLLNQSLPTLIGGGVAESAQSAECSEKGELYCFIYVK